MIIKIIMIIILFIHDTNLVTCYIVYLCTTRIHSYGIETFLLESLVFSHIIHADKAIRNITMLSKCYCLSVFISLFLFLEGGGLKVGVTVIKKRNIKRENIHIHKN